MPYAVIAAGAPPPYTMKFAARRVTRRNPGVVSGASLLLLPLCAAAFTLRGGALTVELDDAFPRPLRYASAATGDELRGALAGFDGFTLAVSLNAGQASCGAASISTIYLPIPTPPGEEGAEFSVAAACTLNYADAGAAGAPPPPPPPRLRAPPIVLIELNGSVLVRPDSAVPGGGADVFSWTLTSAAVLAGSAPGFAAVRSVDVAGFELASFAPVSAANTSACFHVPDDDGGSPTCGGDSYYVDAWSNTALDEWWTGTWGASIVTGNVDINTPAGGAPSCLDGAASRLSPGPLLSILAGGWAHGGRTGIAALSSNKHLPFSTGPRAFDAPGRCSHFTIAPTRINTAFLCGSALPFTLSVGVFSDLTQDGAISSDDIHFWRRHQFPVADVLYRTTLPHKLGMDYTAYGPQSSWARLSFVPDALSYAQNMSRIADGYPLTPILVGASILYRSPLYRPPPSTANHTTVALTPMTPRHATPTLPRSVARFGSRHALDVMKAKPAHRTPVTSYPLSYRSCSATRPPTPFSDPSLDNVNARCGGASGLAAYAKGLVALNAASSVSYHVNSDEAYSHFNGAPNPEFDIGICRLQVDHVTPWFSNCTVTHEQTPDCGIRCSISKTRDAVSHGRYERMGRMFDVVPAGMRTVHSDAWRDVGASWEASGYLSMESENFCGQIADRDFWQSHGVSMGNEGENGQAAEMLGAVVFEYHGDGWDPALWRRIVCGSSLGFDTDVYCYAPGGKCSASSISDSFWLGAKLYQLALTDELLGGGEGAAGRGGPQRHHRFLRGGRIQKAHANRVAAAPLGADLGPPSTWPYGGDDIPVARGSGVFVPLVLPDGTLSPDTAHAYAASSTPAPPPVNASCPLFSSDPAVFSFAENVAFSDWSESSDQFELDPSIPEHSAALECKAACDANGTACGGWDMIKVTPFSGKTKPLCMLYRSPVGCEADDNQVSGVKAPLPVPPPAPSGGGLNQSWTLPLSWVGKALTATTVAPGGDAPAQFVLDGRALTVIDMTPGVPVRLVAQ